MIHGGVYPDLLDDAAWWQTDDLWVCSFFALLIFIRAAAERTGRSVEAGIAPGPAVDGTMTLFRCCGAGVELTGSGKTLVVWRSGS